MGYHGAAPAEVQFGGGLDRPGEECGVLGIWLPEDTMADLNAQGITMASMLYDGLQAQRNRGQQNSGVAVSLDDGTMLRVVGKGTPKKAFGEDGAGLHALPDNARFALGHNRYTTVGGPDGAQPVHLKTVLDDDLALVHNGEMVLNDDPDEEYLFPSDSWRFGDHVVQGINEGSTLSAALIRSASVSEGSFSIAALYQEELVAMRDPRGIRPLVLGQLGGGWVFASETTTLDAIGASYKRQVEPGELIIVNEEGIQSFEYAESAPALCALESIYLANADHLDTREQRYRAGQILAREVPPHNVDVVVPILGSAIDAAQGYADTLGVGIDIEVVTKTDPDKRNFMTGPGNRKETVLQKLSIDAKRVRGLDVDVIDDSRVRGDTFEVVIPLLKQYGAKSVRVIVASSAIKNQCNLGVDLKDPKELAANRMNDIEYAELINADSFHHLSLEGMREAIGQPICDGCFTGVYPTDKPLLSHRLKGAPVTIGPVRRGAGVVELAALEKR